MAKFIQTTLAGHPDTKVWLNADLITNIRENDSKERTVVHFESGHQLSVEMSGQQIADRAKHLED